MDRVRNDIAVFKKHNNLDWCGLRALIFKNVCMKFVEIENSLQILFPATCAE